MLPMLVSVLIKSIGGGDHDYVYMFLLLRYTGNDDNDNCKVVVIRVTRW